MQQYLIMSLCIFTIFISTEARYCGHYSGYDNSGHSNSGYSNSAYSSSGFNSNEYGGGGLSRSGYNSNGYGGGGLSRSGYSSNGYGGGGLSRSGYGNSEYSSRSFGTRRGNYGMSNSAFVPDSCPGCRINNFGNGDHNANTFNLPKEIYY